MKDIMFEPDIYTFHDNAVSKAIDLKATLASSRKSPNIRMDNSPPRDTSMYKISDLSNLDHGKYFRIKNSLDHLLEINNILPHSNTLASKFTKPKNYD